MTAPALLPPSGADVWAYCPGSVLMGAMFPEDEDATETREGLTAHWVAAEILFSYKGQRDRLYVSRNDFVGQADSHGDVVTDTIYEGARYYADDILNLCNQVGGLNDLQVESRVHAANLVHDECRGRADAYLMVPGENGPHLYIWDFKFGFRDIPAFENEQLLCYAAGVLEQLGVNGYTDSDLTVHLRTIQPRCYTANGPFKEWVVNGADLRPYFNWLWERAQEAMGSDPKVISGTQCRHCPARHGCPSAREAAIAGVEYVNSTQPEVLSDEALSYELATLENAEQSIKYRKEALQEEALNRYQSGNHIPGYRVERGKGQRKFSVDPPTLETLAQSLDPNLSFLKPQELKSPAQAEKELKRLGYSQKDIDDLLTPFIERPSTGLKLIKDDGTEARRVFAKGY